MLSAATLKALFHEALLYHGIRVFGKKLDGILYQIADAQRAEVTAKAKEYGLDMNAEDGRRHVAEKVLADMTETQPEIGFVCRAITAILAWLRKHVPVYRTMKLSDDEIIAQYALPARSYVENGKGLY